MNKLVLYSTPTKQVVFLFSLHLSIGTINKNELAITVVRWYPNNYLNYYTCKTAVERKQNEKLARNGVTIEQETALVSLVTRKRTAAKDIDENPAGKRRKIAPKKPVASKRNEQPAADGMYKIPQGLTEKVEPVTALEYEIALLYWIKFTQKQAYKEEWNALRAGKPVSNKSELAAFAPFLDEHACWCVPKNSNNIEFFECNFGTKINSRYQINGSSNGYQREISGGSTWIACRLLETKRAQGSKSYAAKLARSTMADEKRQHRKEEEAAAFEGEDWHSGQHAWSHTPRISPNKNWYYIN